MPSPDDEAAGYVFLVEHDTTRFHPDLRIARGFFIKSSVLNLHAPESRRWVPCVDLAQPRFVSGERRGCAGEADAGG